MAKLNPLAAFEKQRSFDSTLGAQTIMEEGRSRVASRQKSKKLRSGGYDDLPNLRGRLTLLVLLFVVSIGGILGILFLDNQYQKDNATYLTASGELRMLTQRIAKVTAQAVQGNVAAFTQLRNSKDRFDELLRRLGEGVPELVRPDLAKLSEAWASKSGAAGMLTDVNRVLEKEKQLTSLGVAVTTINANDEVVFLLAEKIASIKLHPTVQNSPDETTLANRLVMLSQRIVKNANELLSGVTIDPNSSYYMVRDTNAFQLGLNAFDQGSDDGRIPAINNDEARQVLSELMAAFSDTQKQVDLISEMLRDKIAGAKEAGLVIFNDSDAMLLQAEKLEKAIQDASQRSVWFYAAVGGLTLFALLFVIFALRAYLSVERARTAKAVADHDASEKQNSRNQEAILRLMNELGDLADGDLTVNATVSEDMTGAIADSINYTIEELRILVTRINDAAVRVTQATEMARQNSTDLLASSEQQSAEIQGAGHAVLEMAEHMRQVSANATESAQVARQSLFAAENGAKAVENSIKGMNEIREQIQETSKRIKRLGESSQEIGEIVEMISDITEQTNVLALNAAIQAATAGDAGRGFTVVAEEVQRLAERSGEATKQIAAIVKTIQTDTQDAVSAMEQSTENVVEGARLSDAAGRALTEIGDVSRNLTRLIEEISLATQQQSHSATQVADTMQNILEVNEQATAGTQRTAAAIGELASLANELKGSVAGFKVS